MAKKAHFTSSPLSLFEAGGFIRHLAKIQDSELEKILLMDRILLPIPISNFLNSDRLQNRKIFWIPKKNLKDFFSVRGKLITLALSLCGVSEH